jgi:hypothetical protein
LTATNEKHKKLKSNLAVYELFAIATITITKKKKWEFLRERERK